MDEPRLHTSSRLKTAWGRFRITKLGQVVETILLAILIMVPIRYFIAEPFIVSGASMDHTFKDGEYLVVEELSSFFRTPTRQEVIIFRPPITTYNQTFLQKIFGVHYIKRVIGLPGETVWLQGATTTIINTDHPEGFVLAEPYLNETAISQPLPIDKKFTLGEDQYFVMGDNRNNSSDSRVFGPITHKAIVGRPILRLAEFWPGPQIDAWPGQMESGVVENLAADISIQN